MSDVWLFFTHFFYRAPIYREGVALHEAVGIAILGPDERNAAIIAHSVCKHYALVVVIGRARIMEPYPGSILEAGSNLQKLSRFEDIHPVLGNHELQQTAMCHVAYLFAQLQTIFVRDRIAILKAYTGNRDVRIEHLVLGKTFRYICKHINLCHNYITSPPIMKPPNTATAMKAKKPAMVIATSPYVTVSSQR